MSQYDKFAKDFSRTRQSGWEEFDIFNPYINWGDRVADLGCGNGRFRGFLPESVIPHGNYFGFDLSAELLKIARETHPRDHFFKGSFTETLPFGADNFEVVSAIASFHHCLSKKEQNNFLRECYRILKPGGKIMLTTWILPRKYFWSNFWAGRVFTKNWLIPFGQEKLPRTYRNVSKGALKRLLKKNGFKVLYLENYKDRIWWRWRRRYNFFR